MSENTQPKKVSADKIEVIDQHGQVIQEASGAENAQGSPHPFFRTGPGNIRVFQGKPWMMLLIPILLPFVLVGFVLLLIFAMFFGKTVLRAIKK